MLKRRTRYQTSALTPSLKRRALSRKWESAVYRPESQAGLRDTHGRKRGHSTFSASVRDRGWSRIAYPPDKQEKATQTVPEQAHLLAPAP